MSIGYVSNLVGRFTWAMLADYFGFKTVVTVLATLMVIISFIFPFALQNSLLYCGVIVISFFSCSAIYPLILLQSGKIFGDKVGSKVYGYGLIGVGISTVSVAIIMQFRVYLDYQGICYVVGTIILGAILVAQISSEKQVKLFRKSLTQFII